MIEISALMEVNADFLLGGKMARDTVIKATIDIGAKITDFQTAIKSIQGELNKLNVGSEVGKDLESAFKKVQEGIGNISRLTKNNELNIVDRKEVESTFRKLKKDWDGLIGKLESKKVTSSPLKEESKALATLKQLRDSYNNAISGGNSKIESQTQRYNDQLNTVKNLASEYEKLSNKTGALTIKRDVANQDLKAAEDALKIRKAETEELREAAEEAKKLLATREEQRRIEEENFNKQYVTENGNRKGIKNAREAHMAEWAKPYEEAEEAVRKYNEAIKEQQEAYDKAKVNADSAQKALDENTGAVSRAEEAWKKAKKSLSGYQGALTKLTGAEFQKLKDQLNLEDVGVDSNSIHSYEQLEKVIEQLSEEDKIKATQVVQNIKKYAETSTPAIDKMSESINQAGNQLDELNERQKQLDQMRNSILQFFSIGNAVNLFKRAVRSAVETVKDLDKVMTETAVVTEFSVGDMWSQLPEYTKRANELGVSIHDVYEASTLYYQQGLQTNEVMAVTNATLRMARIASLDAAEATDRVTNALRGFNMEINEANADNIADVYSKLAAISASDVDEISTAMTKVASLASSANMQFENTAAFLAQIIETTRESAETAGTALKTVVARFSEVKELYSKGELLGTDEEGEEVDVNKVSKALRTAGINLNEFLVGNKGLDEIFIELASKWNDLDIVQQRYIATMAAGSRQQSRFIALMSDYARTQELTKAAQDANGAATEQYNKTLESLDTKVTKLKNAWNEFLMSIANSSIIKGTVDVLTGLIGIINKIVNAISGGKGLLKSVAAIGISVGSLKFGRKVFNGLLGNPLTGAKGYITEFMTGLNQPKLIGQAGEKAGLEFFKGFKSLKAIDSNAFWKNMLHPSQQFTASELGLNEIDFRDTRLNFSNVEIPQTVKDSLVKQLDSILPNKVDPELAKSYNDLYASIKAGNFEQARKQAADLNLELKMNSEQLDATGQRFKATGEQVKAFGQSIQMAGGLLVGLATFMEKIFPNAPKVVTKTIRNVGIALMTIPTVLKVVQVAVGIFSKTVSAEIMSIPILGWIAAIITALVTLATVLSEVIETPAEAAENARQALESAIEAANQAAEAVDNLSSSYNSLVEKANKLEDLTKGTLKWKEAVAENNKQVLELLQTYKELQIESKDGVLTITNYEQVLEQYQKKAANLQVGTIGASIRSIKADLDESVANTRSNYAVSYKTVREESSEKDKNNLEEKDYEWKSISDDLYKSIALKVANGELLDAKAVETEINKYVSGVEFISVSDKTVDALRSLGNEINATTQKLNAQYTAIGATATQYVKVTDAQSKYINSLVGNEEAIDHFYNEFREGLSHLRYKNESEEVQKLYEQYVEETYGVSSGNINYKGNFKKDGELIRYQDKKDEFTSWVVATQQFNKQVEASAIKLEELSTSKNAYDRIIAKSYEGNSGDQLTRLDLTTLFEDEDLDSLDLSDLENKKSALYTRLLQIWSSFDETTQEAFGNNFEEWAKQTATNIITANNTITKAYSTFDNEGFKEATEKFNANTIDMITKQLAAYRPDDDGSFGKTIIDKLSDLLNTKASGDIETLEKAVSAFSGVALNSEEDLEEFKDTLASLGVNVADDQFKAFIDDITDGMEILSNIDIDKLATSVESLTQIASDINDQSQNRIFSNDAYDKLKEAGIDMSEFVSRSDGSYLYIGDKLDNIVTAIGKQTDDLLGKGREQLEAKQAAWDLTKTARGLSGKEYLKEVIKNYEKEGLNIGQLGIDGLYGNLSDDKIEILDDKVIESWVAQIKTIAAEQSFWTQELENLNKVEGNSQFMKKNIHQLNSEFSNGGVDIKTLPRDIQEIYYNYGKFANLPELSEEEKEKYRAVMLSKASNIIPIDILEQYINKDWTEEASNDLTALTDLYGGLEEKGLEADQVSKLAQTLQLNMGGTLSAATSKAIELLGAMGTKEVKQEDVEAFAQKIAETTETDMASAMRIAIDTLAMNGEGIIPQEVMDELKSNFNVDTFNSLLSSYQNAQDSELDIQEVQDLTKYLRESKNLAIETATEIAVANMKYNKSLNTLIGSYEDINNLIKNGPLGKGKKLEFTDSEQFKQFNQLKKDLTKALDLSTDLSDSFFESDENIENLSKLLNGSVEEQKKAFGELQKAAAIDLAISTRQAGVDIGSFIDDISTIEIPDLEVGAYIEDKQFIAVLDALMAAAGDAGEEIAAALGVKSITTATYGPDTMKVFDLSAAQTSGGVNPFIEVAVPHYETKWVSTGKGGLNFESLGGGGGRNAKDSSSSSKESKPKLWKNPYDELYNLQEKVNDALREREQLEHRYEDMLKDHTKTSADLVENTYAEVAALKQQLQLNKQLLAGRKGQMSRVGNEMFEDSEGNRTTLTATGATKYGWYDEFTGVVQIDYKAISKITDKNLGNAVAQYISRLEEIRDQINDTEDTIEDINDQLIEIQDRGKEEYLGFEDKVYEAVVNSREKEIEELEEINSTVSDAANKTISAIQDEISKERQVRENEETEQNILDKEMRLAYLQRDTSGANDLEIQKLQEEIANDQQSYQDKIIDQTIQEMQDEAERAAEQRQAQIDLLNWQLKVDQETGAIWQTVSKLLTGAFDEKGNLNTDSSLYKLLYNNESAMSQFGEAKWKQDLAKEIANAMQGRQNWELSTAKENGSLTLGDGTKLKYNKERDAWWDAKNKRFLTDSDLVWDPNSLSYTMPPITKETSVTKPQTKTNEEIKNDNTPETVSYTVQRGDGWWQVAKGIYGSDVAANQQWKDVYQQLQSQGIIELHPGQVVKIIKRYATGGLVNSTGPAWLDGTKSRPEMVLNAVDTQNFITLKNILASILNNTQSNSKSPMGGDNYFDIDIQAEIDSDYDVDRLADRIKQQIAEDASYRNVNMISQMR